MGLFGKKSDKSSKDIGNDYGITLPDQIFKESVFELKDILAPSAVSIASQHIKIGDKYARTYFVVSYPRFITDGWLYEIIQMDKVLNLSLHIHPMATEDILRKFRKKVAEVQSQIAIREQQGLVRDPLLDAAYENLEKLRDQLQQSQERMFSVGFYITIFGSDEKELRDIELEIKSILESKMIFMKPAVFQHDDGYIATSPTGEDSLGVNIKLNTSVVSSFFPFMTTDLTENDGILYGINMLNGGLVIFDRFTKTNYNSVLFAVSGAGKSYATKLEILRSMMMGVDVIVIDPENEYRYLAEASGGRFFDISLSSEYHINPFDLPRVDDTEDKNEIFRSQIIFLVGLFRILLGGLTPEEEAILDRAIIETYSLKDITPESDFADAQPPLISDLEMVLNSVEGAESILIRMEKYTKGSWAGFLNNYTNIDINKNLIVFSIRDMEDDLKPAAMYMITNYIWSEVRREIKKRLLVVDEAWYMMKSEDSASFLFSLAKRGRKYYLGLATITQDVDDFIKSKYGLPIITNSSIQILLKQSPSSIEKIQDVFNLTDEEKFFLLEADRGEGIFFVGNQHVTIKIIASYTEDRIITSDPGQLMSIEREKQKFNDSGMAGEYVN